jgi:hypothetical protein
MWDSQLVRLYRIISLLYMCSYALIIGASMGLRWYVEAPIESSRARLVMLEINMCILCVSLVTFEIKSIFNDKLEYFKSFWNLNDVTLFIISILCLVLEYKNFKYQ